MTGAQIGVVLSICGVLLGVYAAVRQNRKDARDAAAADVAAKQEIYSRGVVDGRASRDDEVRQLTFERDDARRERDANAARSEKFEDLWNSRGGS